MLRVEGAAPVRMRRVALLAPYEALRDTLVRIAEAGCVEIDRGEDGGPGTRGPAALRIQRLRADPADAVLSACPPDLDALERDGRLDLLAGEAQLEGRLSSAVRRGHVAALAGWCPAAEVGALGRNIASVGGSLMPLRTPRGTDPPTLLIGSAKPSGPAEPRSLTTRDAGAPTTSPGTPLPPARPASADAVRAAGAGAADVGETSPATTAPGVISGPGHALPAGAAPGAAGPGVPATPGTAPPSAPAATGRGGAPLSTVAGHASATSRASAPAAGSARGTDGLDGAGAARAPGELRRSFTSLVRTYGTVPYADLDPTMPAGIVYVVMFGLMFGDAGHGLLLLAVALLLRAGRPRRASALRPLWPFVAGAGVAGTLAGVAYGEFFGPTGVLPVLWLDPLDDPMRLLGAAVGFGAVLLAVSYGAGTVNRWREHGPASALYATTGIAGATLYLGLVLIAGYVWLHGPAYAAVGIIVAVTGLVLSGSGLYAATGGGPGGVAQTAVQLFDTVVRIGSNVLSFARLAAFGLTHAALGSIVWDGTTALAGGGPVAVAAAVLVFLAGNALTFALEALIAGVQALRLEFYELFSRVFAGEGRPFRPWHLPVERTEPTLTEAASPPFTACGVGGASKEEA
ncbi:MULTISPECIES: V-type ATPase 116kDa subunit family protein [Streptomyces]|uniref:V-type ATPase 116kDa subunit family protein n=1 Tax=Streptomyces TaxID=1883 RepID=UPI00211B2FE4|nr:MULTISPECIES: V-type ATPase 116kDa subunit family protein [Streptomyces]MDX3633417.1 V-type ATPase 116kDa subunit family protein [Streptomyces europaeiscabiei]MDX3650677.1 V-type ATPase 116kDa subunit family protein [Streptomyces europaeiscabiei]WRZ53733.1 ATPase [Streptomyces sp. NBC_01314]